MFEILRKSGQRRVVGKHEEERKKEGFWRLVLKELWPERKKALFWHHLKMATGFPGGASGKEPACRCRRQKRCGFDPWVRKIPWRRAWRPTPVFLPGESQGPRSLVGYSPWNCSGQNTGVGICSFLQGIFPTQGSNPGLPHCSTESDRTEAT